MGNSEPSVGLSAYDSPAAMRHAYAMQTATVARTPIATARRVGRQTHATTRMNNTARASSNETMQIPAIG